MLFSLGCFVVLGLSWDGVLSSRTSALHLARHARGTDTPVNTLELRSVMVNFGQYLLASFSACISMAAHISRHGHISRRYPMLCADLSTPSLFTAQPAKPWEAKLEIEDTVSVPSWHIKPEP